MAGCREDIMRQVVQAFAQLDKNKDDAVCRDELKLLLEKIFGNQFPEDYIDIIMHKADANHSGTIDSMDELVDALYSIKAIIICTRLIYLLDVNSDGYLTKEELESKLQHCEHKVVLDLIHDVPLDDGRISCEDFFGFCLRKLL